MNPLLDPSQTLSGRALAQAADALANVQTAGPLTELQRQIAANNAQTQGTVKLVGGYYNQLEPFVQKGAANSGNIATGLNSTLSGIGADTQNQLAGIGQSGQANISKYAPPGDGSTSNAAASDLAAQIATQRGLAAQQAGTYRSFGASQGANYQGAANANLGAYGMQGQEALRGIAQSGTVKNQPLVSKIADLRASQGALVATDLGKLRQQEVNNDITRAGLQLNQQKVATTVRGQNITAANDRAKNSIAQGSLGVARTRANTTANQVAFNNDPSKVGSTAWERVQKETGSQFANNPNAVGSAAWARVQAANRPVSGARGGGTKPLTPNENNVANTRINNIVSAIRTWQQGGIKNGKGQVIEPHPTNAQMRQILGGQYASPMVEAAFDLLGYGVLTPGTARALSQMGVRGTTYQGRPARVGNPRATGGAIQGVGTGNLLK